MSQVLIVQPYGYVSNNEYVITRLNAIEELESHDYIVVNETQELEWYTDKNMLDIGIRNATLCRVSKSLEALSTCTHAYFCSSWDRTEHGRTIHEFARKYDIRIIYEGGEL